MSNEKREWTDDEVANLIQLYEHEFLWNVKHTLYRNREKKMSMTNLQQNLITVTVLKFSGGFITYVTKYVPKHIELN